MTFTTRFAPSPTGPLHLGHAYSAMLAHDMAMAKNGEFLLRIEDIDRTRSKTAWEAQIYDDLAWLGLTWSKPVMRQSARLQTYAEALQNLWEANLTFACTCSRRDIMDAASAPQEGGAPLVGPDGVVYPGTCHANTSRFGTLPFPDGAATRLDTGCAITAITARNSDTNALSFEETGSGPNGKTGHIAFTSQSVSQDIGDIVLARRDIGTSYHLSVVMDDAAQGITHVVRGHDLFEATKIHVVLQRVLGYPTPIYHHHKLVRDDAGKRLAKRDDARSIATFRDAGATPQDIRKMVGL